jgi:hypothetical protein
MQTFVLRSPQSYDRLYKLTLLLDFWFDSTVGAEEGSGFGDRLSLVVRVSI